MIKKNKKAAKGSVEDKKHKNSKKKSAKHEKD